MPAFTRHGPETIVQDSGYSFMQRHPADDGYFRYSVETVGTPPSGTQALVQNYDVNGVPTGPEIVLQPDSGGVSAVQLLPNGNYVALFVREVDTDPAYGPAPDIYGQVFDPTGSRLSDEFVVTDKAGFQWASGIERVGDGFVVVWVDATWMNEPSDFEIRSQLFATDGSKVGSEEHVNTTTFDRQDSASVVTLEGGGYVIVWEDSSGNPTYPSGDDPVWFQRGQVYDANGERIGNEIQLNTTTDVASTSPGVVALSGGGFLAYWSDYPNDAFPDAHGLRFQMFDAQGVKVGAEHHVAGDQGIEQGFRIAAFDFGGFVAVWQEAQSDITDNLGDIVAQTFDADGNPIGERFVVNDTTEGWQLSHSVMTLPSGDFIVNWSHGNQGDVRSQVFSLVADIEGDGVIKGTGAAQSIRGGDHGDTIFGLAGDDLLFGDNGNDVLKGGTGDDYLWGGAGTDTADYAEATAGVTVSLALNGPQQTGSAGIDILSSIEDLRGSRLGDVLIGNDNANRIKGETGNDTIFGQGGDDFLFGDAGSDVIDGGEGRDTLAGGGGIDTFVFTSLDGDLVKDWQDGETVDVSGVHAVGFALIHSSGKVTARFDLDGDGEFDDGSILFHATGITAADFVI